MNILKQSTAVDVLIGPFVDSTDGDTEETALTIAAADVKLSKNGQTMAGKNDVTACAHDANGMYNCELDATDTNTVGTLVIFVHEAGALAVRHEFQIVEEAVYDALFGASATGYLQPTTAGRTLDVTATGAAGVDWGNIENAGTTVDLSATSINLVDTATDVTNQVTADMTAISGDATAADNLEAMYDGTGYTADTAPASRAQVGSLSTGSAAISTIAESYTLTTGTQSSGTISDTQTRDSVRHEHTDATGAMDLYYQFDVGGNGTAVESVVYGYLSGANDSLTIQAYDWGNTQWDTVGTLAGTNGTTDAETKYNLLARHTGTGANLGKVRIRFFAASGLTTATLRIDQIYLSYSVVTRSVGYDGGQVWIDTTATNTSTESYVDGVADNPVSTIAAANTIAGNIGLHSFSIAPGSSLTLAATQSNETFHGEQWTLALGGQNIGGTRFVGASNGVSGTGTGTNPFFHECSIGTVTLPPCAMQACGLSGTMTVGSAGDFFLIDCFSQVAGASSPTLDMGAAVGASNVSIRRWSGGITISNLAAGDVVSLEGIFGTITLNGADATVEIRGIAKAVTNNLTGSPTVNDNSVKADDIASILADTNELQSDDVPGLIAALNDLSAAEVNAEVLDVLNTDTFSELSSIPAATTTMTNMLRLLYSLARNKTTQTSTTFTLRNDGDTGNIGTATVSDDGTTATKGEIG